MNCTGSFSETLDCTPHLMKHLFEQTKYICTNKYKCQDLTHKCKHMSSLILTIWQYDRLKSLLNGNVSQCLWKEWPDKSTVINLMSLGNTLFFTSVMVGWLIVAGQVTKEWMPEAMMGRLATTEKSCQPHHLTLLLDRGRIKHKFLNLPAQGCQETNHHPTTLWGH